MISCLFVSDLHGDLDKYRKLFKAIYEFSPDLVFLGGDLLPSGAKVPAQSRVFDGDFISGFMAAQFLSLREIMRDRYPQICLIMGNDDERFEEEYIVAGEAAGLWYYIHNRKIIYNRYSIYGYSYVPPSPFLLKDWERYDVSRFVDPGSVSPEEGYRTIGVSEHDIKYATIADDLNSLIGDDDLARAIFLFHTPPHMTNLDKIAVSGKMIDYVPLDPNVGSIAVRRMIEIRQPLITLHGHIHESAEISGSWRDRIGKTHLFSAAHSGLELALVRFDLDSPFDATRILL
jgi:Icc-related predicted phosphoesterase